MPKARDLLQPGYVEAGDGFRAEVGANGELQSFGFYRDGEAVGWTLEREGVSWHARRSLTTQPGDDGAGWLEDTIAMIYREAEASHYVCAFCEKTNAEVAQLIAGPRRYTFICNECVLLCHGIVQQHNG